MGRPKAYDDEARVCLHPRGNSKLHPGGDRRAIVELLLENGGCMTLAAIDEHYGFSVRDRVLALVRAGWLEVER